MRWAEDLINDLRVGMMASPEDLNDLTDKTIQLKLTLLHGEVAYAVADDMFTLLASLTFSRVVCLQSTLTTKDYKNLPCWKTQHGVKLQKSCSHV